MREMKVLLYAKNEKIVSRSGVGRAMFMQKNALKSEQVELTCDPREDFDIVHLNTVFPSDYHMAKKAKREGKKVVYHAHSTKEDFRNSFVGSNLTAPLFKWWIMKCYQMRFDSDTDGIFKIAIERIWDQESDRSDFKRSGYL